MTRSNDSGQPSSSAKDEDDYGPEPIQFITLSPTFDTATMPREVATALLDGGWIPVLTWTHPDEKPRMLHTTGSAMKKHDPERYEALAVKMRALEAAAKAAKKEDSNAR